MTKKELKQLKVGDVIKITVYNVHVHNDTNQSLWDAVSILTGINGNIYHFEDLWAERDDLFDPSWQVTADNYDKYFKLDKILFHHTPAKKYLYEMYPEYVI